MMTAQRAYLKGFSNAQALLRSMLHEIEEYWASDDPTPLTPMPLGTTETPNSNRVFVVSGRDEGTTDTVARFLGTLELEPVVLREQPNEGRTIIEKFEDYARVGFAVILCTPDDVGALAVEPDRWRSRPRQNVILELGFFLGKIGRQRVCALIKGDLEIPSDYSGVVYITMDDAQGWQLQLSRELRQAGLPVDANRIL